MHRLRSPVDLDHLKSRSSSSSSSFLHSKIIRQRKATFNCILIRNLHTQLLRVLNLKWKCYLQSRTSFCNIEKCFVALEEWRSKNSLLIHYFKLFSFSHVCLSVQLTYLVVFLFINLNFYLCISSLCLFMCVANFQTVCFVACFFTLLFCTYVALQAKRILDASKRVICLGKYLN